ncbi:hypothetical protein GOBAR_DD36062 [Gossypium barbadense]|nr:hypothetical protein GOBAR_DD36062 [Gossypium barbadense]
MASLAIKSDDPTVEENGRKLLEVVMAKVSYKNTLIRSSTTSDSPQNVEDFELQEGDVMTEMIDGILSITFSERVHKFIERKMATTIIVKLLGQKITFNALLNKIMISDLCPKNRPLLPMNDTAYSSPILKIHDLQQRVEDENYRPWMLVDC